MTLDDGAALLPAAALILTMPVYGIAARGRPRDADLARRPATALLGHWVRGWAVWVIAPIERALIAARVAPATINAAGVILGIAAAFAYARGVYAPAGWLLLLAGGADVLDGRVARAAGRVTDAGAFLDSTLDRFAETFVYAGIAVGFAPSRPAVLAAVAALGGSLLVSYARARGEGLGVHFKGGLMQRAERVVVLAVASLLDGVVAAAAGWPAGRVLMAAVALIGAASLATAAYRTLTIARALGRGAPRR
ncbi:MAG: CDP-alcohol phosphatidyltransferase family protein [Candidatus Eisenbacteria bacterium]|nr:CDP-alcohol phosphatidyltransferase family protein [Candidatus Eisenbacteria bacterium]